MAIVAILASVGPGEPSHGQGSGPVGESVGHAEDGGEYPEGCRKRIFRDPC